MNNITPDIAAGIRQAAALGNSVRRIAAAFEVPESVVRDVLGRDRQPAWKPQQAEFDFGQREASA